MNTDSILKLLEPYHKSGDGWQACCPVLSHEDRDPSLSIKAEKGKTLLYCHAGCSTEEVVKALGLTMQDLFTVELKHEPKPKKLPKLEMDKRTLEYFKNTRKISERTLQKRSISNRLIYCKKCEKKMNSIVYPYFQNEKIVNEKYRDGHKHFSQMKGGKQILWNIDNVDKILIIVEGEDDAMSFMECGYEYATSVPSGSVQEKTKDADKKMEFLRNSEIDKVEKVYIAVDNDVSGDRLKKELIERLKGKEVLIIKYPEDCKDANDVLQKHSKVELTKCYENAKKERSENLYTIVDIMSGVQDIFCNGFPDAVGTGFVKFDQHFKFHPGMFTVISGFRSHGKSTFLDQLFVKLMKNANWKIGLHSPENATLKIHAKRLLEQMIGNHLLPGYDTQMTYTDMMLGLEYLNEHIYYIKNDLKMLTAKEILEKGRELVEEYGINVLAIDPWNSIKHDTTQHLQYNAELLNEFRYFSRRYNIHVIMVAHPRKPDVGRERTMPLLEHVSGADFHNIADNGIIIFRKKNEAERDDYTKVHITKIRDEFVGKEGYIKFDFKPKGQRYTEMIEENEVNNF